MLKHLFKDVQAKTIAHRWEDSSVGLEQSQTGVENGKSNHD